MARSIEKTGGIPLRPRALAASLAKEKALRASHAQFSAILDQSPVGVLLVDAQLCVRHVNAKARPAFGGIDVAPGRELGGILRQIWPDGMAEEILRHFRSTLVTGESYHQQRFPAALRGRARPEYFDWELHRLTLPDGDMGVACYFFDVTSQVLTEQTLKENEEQLRITFDQAAVGMATARLDGRIERANPRFAEITGYSADELLDRTFLEITHPGDLAETKKELARLLAGEIPKYTLEKRYLRKDGSHVWSLTTVALVKDSAGRPQRMVGVIEDITEARQTRRELREASIITEHLNDVAKAIATELDLAKVVQIITDAATRITRAQFGAFFYNVTDDRGDSYMLYALSGVPRAAFAKFPMPRSTRIFAPTFNGEGVVRMADVRLDPRFGHNPPYHGMPPGHLPVVSYLAAPVISRSGAVLGGLFFGHPEAGVFTARDETILVGIAAQAAAAMDNARLYQNEQHARAAAEKANQAKDHFLATLSHELRTPLTPVLAILSNLTADSRLPVSWMDDLETMRRNVELEARLIDDLLDLTRIAQGKLELHREKKTLGSLVENAITTCLGELKQKNLTLVRDLDEPDRTLTADSARMTQVLWNLLKNAIKFTPEEGTITIRTRIETNRADGQPRLLFEVEDNGIGIEAASMPRVFDAFEQGGRAITQRFGGLGLGLAISKAIVEAHRGEISARSEGPGRGSTFAVVVPCDPKEDATTPAVPLRRLAAGKKTATDERRTKQARILFVEDHADTAKVLKILLERDGYVVIHASTVAESLARARQEMAGEGLDIVVSDLGLPDGSGLEIMRELSVRYGLRGIALSGFGMESDREETAKAGFIRHITKPVDSLYLRATIAEIIRT